MPVEVTDLILAEVQSVGQKQDGMSAKLDAYMLATDQRLTWLEAQVRLRAGNGQPGMCAINSSRLTALERWRNWVTGIAAAVGAMVGTAATWLGLAVHYWGYKAH